MKSVFIFAIVFICFSQHTEALSCRRCTNKEEICGDYDTSICKYGLALDMCGCCDVCAKGPGEICGGIWNYGGTCGKGLNCHRKKKSKDNQEAGVCSTRPLPPGTKPWPLFKK
ncbi:hypothetical protein CHUAL_001982 [Chamberlinius hualienensis]